MSDRETREASAQQANDIVHVLQRQAKALERIADFLDWAKTEIEAEKTNHGG